MRQLYDQGDQPLAQAMHTRAAERCDPAVRAALTGRPPSAATTTGRRLSDIISGDTLPRPHELFDLLNALSPEPPGRDEVQAWLADLEAARRESPAARDATATPAAPPDEPAPDQPTPRRRRRWLVVGVGALVFVGGGTGAGLALSGTSHANAPEVVEIAAGNAHTWSDPQTAGGKPGTALVDGQQVGVICRVEGFKVDDGNVWWYRLGDGYHGAFYATADAFWNEPVPANHSLKGTPFIDPAVPVC